MPAPLSNDMRIRIIKARERGDTIAQIAREKEVNQSTIVRLLRLYRETGSHEARPLNNGRKPRLSPETLEIIRERI
jgi:transposase